MNLKQILLTVDDERNTPIPDEANWSNMRINKAGTHKVGEYSGSSNVPLILDFNGVWPEVDESKLIDMGMLAELLPDAVILELEDFKANTGATAAKRKAAARILLIIASNRQWDVYGPDYETLMTKIANNTALTSGQATAITDILKG